jgi:hypothetical protein
MIEALHEDRRFFFSNLVLAIALSCDRVVWRSNALCIYGLIKVIVGQILRCRETKAE